jgi:sulfate permease, SulP family
VVVLRFDGGLFFATAEALEDRTRRLVEDGDMRTLVLNMEGAAFVDSQGARKLTELHAYLASEGVSLRLARLRPQVERVLEADGFTELAGADHIHRTINLALEAEEAQRATAGD